ncbi:hypothetical protein CMU51_09055 [Elizabethkingia anophelis]|uniref:DUF2726 domain-containing protein n=1 Tax=Elizabethkingia anophelis TaxID=1117645 RepID=A0AAE4P152_9FLAO|nr:hypothetical protein [Elizabethkingia anophelis]
MKDPNDIFILLQQRKFLEIIGILKDNKVFNELLNDFVFKTVFFQNFINELFNESALEIEYPAFLYHCHSSNEYVFKFSEEDEEKVLMFLIDNTKKYLYAIKLPYYSTSIEIINEYKAKMSVEAEKAAIIAKKEKDFEIVEKYSNNTESLLKSIFNSPQEKEFYLACTSVFKNYIVLPNVSLTTIFNATVVKKKFSKYFDFYLKSSIDFVLVEDKTFIPILFFELDSKGYHSDKKAKFRDEIKDILLTELGHDLIRMTKKTGKEGVHEYFDFLEAIKEERGIE